MNRFQQQLCFLLLLVLLALFASLRVGAIRTTTFSTPSSTSRQVFRPRDRTNETPSAGGEARDLVSQKRKVPTGSNPLHNKRRWVIFNLFSLLLYLVEDFADAIYDHHEYILHIYLYFIRYLLDKIDKRWYFCMLFKHIYHIYKGFEGNFLAANY